MKEKNKRNGRNALVIVDEVGKKGGHLKRRICSVLEEVAAEFVDAIGLGLGLRMECELPLGRVKSYS